ncbi:MAG: hypothetical protein SGI88_01635 [Candidatus Hydrogenedentes bacterium]|nr:hypothetical protein [Candidatus Hydrogenedentota bacterium]
MNISTMHLRVISRQNPTKAELQPVWEFIFVGQALLGLFGTVSGFGLQYLAAFESLAGVLLAFKGSDNSES